MEKEVIVDGKVINLEVTIFPSRYGIQQDKKSSEVWEVLFIVEQIAAYLCTTSPTNEYTKIEIVFRQY